MILTDPTLRAVLRAPLSAARASGRPIVLYVSNNVPVELIHACGAFPLQLPTSPRPDYPRADRYLEPGFEPMVRAALEQLLAGELASASLLVLPRTLDAWQRLYYYLCELGRSFGERLPEPFLYDLQSLPNDSSADYNLVSTRLLADKLHALTGVAPSDDALWQSSELYNRVRRQLTSVTARRHQQPCQLSGADALQLYAAAQRLDPAVLLETLTPLMAAQNRPAPGTRTLLVGSTHDTPALHRLIAAAGGQVVADFHRLGDWSLGPVISSGAPALQALSDHYHRHSLSPRSFPLPLPALLELAAASGAEAAVFYYYEEEEALTWDYPEQAEALAARGVPSLLLARQSYPPSPSAELAARLRVFFREHARSPA